MKGLHDELVVHRLSSRCRGACTRCDAGARTTLFASCSPTFLERGSRSTGVQDSELVTVPVEAAVGLHLFDAALAEQRDDLVGTQASPGFEGQLLASYSCLSNGDSRSQVHSMVSVLACIGDPVVSGCRYRGHLQRSEHQPRPTLLPPKPLVDRRAEAGAARLCREHRRPPGAAGEPFGGVVGRSRGSVQHSDQRSIPRLLRLVRVGTRRSRDRRLSLRNAPWSEYQAIDRPPIQGRCSWRSS